MKLIKHKNNRDIAYKVDYMVPHGKLCHYYGGWINLRLDVPLVIDTGKLVIPLSDMHEWVEKDVDFKEYHKSVEWKEVL